MCDSCVHVMRLKGGQPLFLCPLCSRKCEPIEVPRPAKKKTFGAYLTDTVKLKFERLIRRRKSPE
jgi:hypothetical protein